MLELTGCGSIVWQGNAHSYRVNMQELQNHISGLSMGEPLCCTVLKVAPRGKQAVTKSPDATFLMVPGKN